MKSSWSKLDNAAKIFPSADSKADTQVFRFSCELTERVDPLLLQRALDETLKQFELYKRVLKRGVFWYYLESTDIKPVVRKEYKPLCAPLYDKNKKGLLFEVTYFQNRVNLEIYHVLTDGTGAMHFLQQLITKYLSCKYQIEEPLVDYDASLGQMVADSFQKYCSDKKCGSKHKEPRALRLWGARYSEDRLKVLTGVTDAKQVLEQAHRYNATLTAYLCASLIAAIGEEASVRAKRRPVVVAVPVNLRKFFPSESARNFFSLISVRYNFSKSPGTFEDIIQSVEKQLKQNLTKENLAQNIDTFASLEHNVFARIVPLAVKDIALKIAYGVSQKTSTVTLSNVGIVNMPEPLSQYIRTFNVCASTNRLQACVCSYNGRLSIDFTSPFISSDIQRRFFRDITEKGIPVEISTNIPDGREEEL